jgi:hypothetical protein
MLPVGVPRSALAIPFEFGISSSITVVANVDVLIPAAIINRGAAPIAFCASVSCPEANYGAIVMAGPEEGLNALNFVFLNSGTEGFFAQFVGVTLPPNGRFDIIFGKINFDPSISVGNPLGTVLHPTFGFQLDQIFARVDSIVSVGTETTFSPLTFSRSESSVPEPPMTLLLLGAGIVGLIIARRAALFVEAATPNSSQGLSYAATAASRGLKT